MFLQEKCIDLQENGMVLQEKCIDLQENGMVLQEINKRLV